MSRQPMIGHFHWFDLATPDVGEAASFYAEMFGWDIREEKANGGVFNRLTLDDRDVGSLYRMSAVAAENGARPHWTPYVLVADIEISAAKAEACGGRVLVKPFDVVRADGELIARIALIADSVGARIGLWQAERQDGSGRSEAGNG